MVIKKWVFHKSCYIICLCTLDIKGLRSGEAIWLCSQKVKVRPVRGPCSPGTLPVGHQAQSPPALPHGHSIPGVYRRSVVHKEKGGGSEGK